MDEVRPLGRFSASDRIRKRSEFRAIQDASHRVVSRGFVFLLSRSLASDATAPSRRRLGVTASRRVGNAAQRNRAKRLSREAFRCVRNQFPPGLDLVVIVRQGLGERSLADVVSEWRSCRARIERRFAELPSLPLEARSQAPVAVENTAAKNVAAKNSC